MILRDIFQMSTSRSRPDQISDMSAIIDREFAQVRHGIRAFAFCAALWVCMSRL